MAHSLLTFVFVELDALKFDMCMLRTVMSSWGVSNNGETESVLHEML